MIIVCDRCGFEEEYVNDFQVPFTDGIFYGRTDDFDVDREVFTEDEEVVCVTCIEKKNKWLKWNL
jgi:hypothetical protein